MHRSKRVVDLKVPALHNNTSQAVHAVHSCVQLTVKTGCASTGCEYWLHFNTGLVRTDVNSIHVFKRDVLLEANWMYITTRHEVCSGPKGV